MEDSILEKIKTDSLVSASLFNATIVASAIVGANEIGLLQKLQDSGSISLQLFCIQNNVQEFPFKVLLSSLQSYQIVVVAEGIILKGQNFNDIFSNKGYFIWLVKGYSYILENIDLLLKANSLNVSNVKRNGAFIAKAGKDYGANFVDAYFNETIKKIKPKYIADFGCGSADRLISIVQNDSSIKAIGIDLNPDAVELAKKNIKTANLEDSVEVICADISTLKYEEKFEDVDLLFSFFMGHDLFPKKNCFLVYNNLKKIFPKANTFLLCDTYRSESNATGFPIFTLGFELTHAFMGQMIPTYNDWLDLFSDLSWKLNETIDIAIPYSKIFNLRIR